MCMILQSIIKYMALQLFLRNDQYLGYNSGSGGGDVTDWQIKFYDSASSHSKELRVKYSAAGFEISNKYLRKPLS